MSRESRVRILRVIARLNVGGPAIQAITLSRVLDERGYETRLVRGREGPREGSMDALAEELSVKPVSLPMLQRRIGLGDVAALLFLRRQIRDWRPDVLHTHAAKAGALGRLAAVLSGRARPPVIVHTFHGHVLTGYFSPRVSALFRWIEWALARVSTRLIAVSEEVRDDLVRLRVAPPERIIVIPLGFDLSGFEVPEQERLGRRSALRAGLGIPPEVPLVTLVGRLEPIKRVDRFLRVANLIEQPRAWFLVVGDGSLREELQESPEAGRLGERLVWAGLRADMPDVYFAADVLAVTSDNEGTAVTAIEAQAAGLPVVTTRVGGMPSVVADGETGFVIEREDDEAFSAAVSRLLLDDELRLRLGSAGRKAVKRRFSLDRLVGDIDALYAALLTETAAEKGVPALSPSSTRAEPPS
jgi:glycosyltransferase involved in cell wall biosynthesis